MHEQGGNQEPNVNQELRAAGVTAHLADNLLRPIEAATQIGDVPHDPSAYFYAPTLGSVLRITRSDNVYHINERFAVDGASATKRGHDAPLDPRMLVLTADGADVKIDDRRNMEGVSAIDLLNGQLAESFPVSRDVANILLEAVDPKNEAQAKAVQKYREQVEQVGRKAKLTGLGFAQEIVTDETVMAEAKRNRRRKALTAAAGLALGLGVIFGPVIEHADERREATAQRAKLIEDMFDAYEYVTLTNPHDLGVQTIPAYAPSNQSEVPTKQRVVEVDVTERRNPVPNYIEYDVEPHQSRQVEESQLRSPEVPAKTLEWANDGHTKMRIYLEPDASSRTDVYFGAYGRTPNGRTQAEVRNYAGYVVVDRSKNGAPLVEVRYDKDLAQPVVNVIE